MGVHLTKHGQARVGQRCGLRRKTIQRMADAAFQHGISHREFAGSFRKYLEGLLLDESKANHVRVYSEKVWLFADTFLITVWHLPHEFVSAANRAKKEAA